MDYQSIRIACEKNKQLTREVLDEFLLYYAAKKDRLEQEMIKRLGRYKHITTLFEQSWVNMMMAQYIAHRIFKKDGLIHKYLNHSEIKNLPRSHREYLERQSAKPWQFSFSIITGRPEEDFFEMLDVFRNEKFLLYSPGTTELLSTQGALLWFNLIAYTGSCWESYGPIGAYKGFDPDDIFYYATELNPHQVFEYDIDVTENVENNPVPYMMLLSGANYPLTVTQGEQIIQAVAEYETDNINTKELQEDFRIEYNEGIYRFSLNEWGEHPHFALAYFDENKKILQLHAMTDRGFEALGETLNKHGFEIDDEPDIRVHLSMVTTAEQILKKKIQLNAYDHLFDEETSEADQEGLDKLNAFLALVMEDINAGKKPDVDSMAKEAGLDPENAREIFTTVMKKFDEMKNDQDTE